MARNRDSLKFIGKKKRKFSVPLRLCVSALCFCILTACQPEVRPTPVTVIPSVMPKLLATVYISPTPDAAELQATRQAQPPTPSPQPTPIPPTATVYIGVFLGEAEVLDEGDIPPLTPVSPRQQQQPTPEAQVTQVVFANCDVQPDAAFGVLWQTSALVVESIGCPIEPRVTIDGSAQVFERGVMYFNPAGQVWAIAQGDPAGRYWDVSPLPAEQPAVGSAPEGMRVPALGFGAVWAGVEGVSDALGYARTDETPSKLTLQRFQGGALLLDGGSGQVFALVGGSTAYGPY